MVTYNDASRLQSVGPTSLVLIMNKKSMVLDPIDWPRFKDEILEWAALLQLEITIPEWTNQLFLERSLPLRGTRVPVNLTPYDLGHVYRFFNPFVPRRCEQKHMIDCGIPSDLAGLLDRANRHDRFLSTLGILPNQLRTILKRLTDHHAEAWLDISKTLFWSGYAIWKRRQILVKKYWREIVPEEWKKNSLQKKKKRKTMIIRLIAQTHSTSSRSVMTLQNRD